MADKTIETLQFEEVLAELEEIVQKLEEGDVPLEEALDQFTKGMALSAHCRQKLDDAEETLAKIVDETGAEVPFEEDTEI